MENLNGALGFKATLDIDDFNVSAQAMERHIRQVSTTTVSEAAQMDQSIQQFAQNGARYIVSYLVGQGMSSLLQSIVQTRGEFQQLEIAFGTMLKSDSKAKQLMDELVVTAAKTPFDLQGIANSAKQMMAYGSTVDNVVDELVMLGNVASGVGAPLGEIAYLYGTLRTQGRAYAMDIRQFAGRGIPIYEELAKILKVNKDQVAGLVSEGKVGFAEVEKVFQNLTSSTGMYYNLMEKQSKSLPGMIANLGDAWDSALNKLGTDNQDLFADSISGATYLVEHFEDVLRIVKAITIAYGSYKAAIVLNTLATKGYTGVALLDNTARQAKIALMKLDANLTGQTARQTQLMTAAEKAHTAALQQKLTAEEHANLVKKLRIATIQQLLTAQQQEYLSNLNLTASSANYEAVAMGVLTVEQREALSKTDLSAKSAVYRAALAQEVAAKTQNQAATLNSMRAEVSAAAAKVEAAKQGAIASMQATEAARYEVYWAKQSGQAHLVAAAEKKLEAAQDNQALARKAALAAQTDFFAKKKALEAAATRQSTVATSADTTAKAANAAGTSILTAITTKATLAMKALWASMMSNPIGWILGLVGALVSVLTLFRSKEEEATDAMGDFQETTRKEIDSLELLFAVMQNSERGTKTHKDAIEKVNAICKEYNKTLLDENATLAEQKAKYEELTTAIQNTTAEKIKAKYTEQALQKAQKAQTDALEDLKEAAEDAEYYSHTVYSPSVGAYSVYNDSKSIQDASAAVWDAVEAEAIQSANDLKELTGDAYTQAFNQALSRITGLVQTATGATDKEMNAFNSSLKTYLTDVVNSSKTAQDEINKVNQQLSAFFAPQDTTPVTQSVDYVSMSFEELDKKAKETQTEIDTINAKKVKVDTDTSKLTELLSLLGQINTAIDTKTSNLNTEAGINARIKQLKDERSNVEINSARYKELTKDIQTLEGKLPKTTGGGGANNIANARKELSQKQLEADRKLEEDRIAVMDEGYAKRKATLDLQHKLNLAQIDKEEKELAEARKKAGKGGLSATEKAGFQERRNLEDQSYEKANTDLFDEEISYRKEQYQLYFRWVKAMGADVANKQFEDLLKGGASYSQWIDQEIAKLEQKKAQDPGSFSAGDQENLFSLNIQRDEINGVRSAMDLFNESVSQSVGQAATLAAKIEAIAKAKDDLANGKFKLGADETLEAQNQLDTMEREAQQELNQAVLNDFKSYEEKKSEIVANYAAMRLTDVAQNNAELLARINKGEADALSAINAEQLQASTDWKNLFQNLDSLTAGEIQKLITSIENAMASADLKLSPVDYQALMDSLNKAKEKVVELNPFRALGSAFDSYIKACKKLKRAEQDNLSPEQITALEKQVKTSAQQMTASIQSINQVVGAVGDSMASLASSFGAGDLADTIGGVTDALAGAGETAMGVGKIMSGDLIGGITSVIGGITSVITAFNKMHDARKEKQIKKLQEQVDQLASAYDDLGDAIGRAYSTDKASMLEQQNENLEQQNEKIRQQIQAEKDKKDTDWDRIKEWEQQIADNEKQIAENTKYNIIDAINGTDIMSAIDDLSAAYADAWAAGETAAGKSANSVKNMIRTAIIEQLKNKLKPEVEKFMTYLATAMEDGVISEAEERMLEQMEEDMEEISDNYLSKNEKWMRDDKEEDSEDPLTGAVRSMSEETGGAIAGRMNAIVINQSDQTVIMRNQLIYQAEIAANTRASASELSEIKATLKRIENKDSSLLSQGIS
ncbi:MAG: phage tail tape measure protein [Bacteroidales bacterium]|nr:phage tail tape measure protein [Bacteroidales bacterium]